MKKTLAILMIALMILSSSALASDLGVQMIGGGDIATQTVSLDDMKLEQTYTIDGYARIQPLSFTFVDTFPQYGSSQNGNNARFTKKDNTLNGNNVIYYYQGGSGFYDQYYNEIYWQNSGENADFAWLLVDVTNRQMSPLSTMEQATVKVVFDDEYEFNGWVRQFNYDYDSTREYAGSTGYGTLIRAAIDPDNEEPIEMMYTGHYVFGCTLPNAVVSGKEPLRMEIDLGGNELTYHIRK